MDKKDIRDDILDIMVVSLEAQVKALKKLRGPREEAKPRKKSTSQLSMAYDILVKAKKPLHISEIIAEAEKAFGVKLERESVVSSLSKKVNKGERFIRTDKNTFALKER